MNEMVAFLVMIGESRQSLAGVRLRCNDTLFCPSALATQETVDRGGTERWGQ